MQQRSPEWYELRCGRITGSRFAKAMSLQSSQAYRTLVDDLVRERLQGGAEERGYVSDAMQWGIDYEDAARHWYARSRNVQVSQIAFVIHPEFDFVGVSPDGLVGNDGLVEIKCPQPENFRKVATAGSVPSRYRWQVQGQLWVCQRGWLDFVCFYPPGNGIVIRVARDPQDADRLAERCEQINREVVKRVGSSARRPTPTSNVRRTPAVQSVAGRSSIAPKSSTPQPGRSQEVGIPGWVWVIVVIAIAVWLTR